MTADREMMGLGIYSLEPEKLERLTRFGHHPVWLSDSRRLLFTDSGAKLYLIDSQSRKTHEILSVAPHRIDTPTLSPDDRLMYFSVAVTEADIWLATLK
jgi:hypothetical protein